MLKSSWTKGVQLLHNHVADHLYSLVVVSMLTEHRMYSIPVDPVVIANRLGIQIQMLFFPTPHSQA